MRNPIDALLNVFAPKRALQRARARAALRIYDAASHTRRTTAFRDRRTSANTEINFALTTLRERSREFVRNSPWAPRILDIVVANTIGTGITPVPMTGNDRLDMRVMKLWDEWTNESDAEGVISFDAQQALAIRSMLESGEVVARFIDLPLDTKKRGTRVPLKIQLLESDFIDSFRDGPYGETPINNTIRSRLGVGLGPNDYHTGLWLWPWHPGEFATIHPKQANWWSRFVPREEILHLYKVQRPGQVRGVPLFAPVMTMARDSADFVDAALVKARVEACFAAFVTNSDEFEQVLDPTTQDVDSAADTAN